MRLDKKTVKMAVLVVILPVVFGCSDSAKSTLTDDDILKTALEEEPKGVEVLDEAVEIVQRNLLKQGPVCLIGPAIATLEQGQTAVTRSAYKRATERDLASHDVRRNATDFRMRIVYTRTRHSNGGWRFCATARPMFDGS